MKQKLFLTLLSALLALTAIATVPRRYVAHHVQPDGTTLTLTRWANGHIFTCHTTDGIALIQGSDHHYYYATLTDGTLQSTERLAHNADLRTSDEADYLAHNQVTASEALALLSKQLPTSRLLPAKSIATSTTDGLGSYKQSAAGVVKSIGQPIIPVIMANFADRTFQDTIDAAKVTRLFNEEGYHDETYTRGSVKDYFTSQSNGLFIPSFEVVATITLPEGYAYYGKNSTSGYTDVRLSEFVSQSISQAAESVSFSSFATDGEVPLVVIMYAGPGEHSSFEEGCSDYIWAQFSQCNVTTDNGATRIRSFFVGNELLQNYSGTIDNPIVSSTHIDGIGLFCHEFGHALGLPDFYYTGSNETVSDTLRTMDYWSIMDYGQYFRDGYLPPGYTAYERSYMGWLDVKELTQAQYAELYPFSRADEGATAYVLRNPDDECEYYLLENRQPDTWYSKRMGQGMLITHVDYDRSAWTSNSVNTQPNHLRMDFVPADNVKDGISSADGSLTTLFNGYKGDLYPGTSGNTSFTDTSVPAATLLSGSIGLLGKPLYNIALSADGVISFSYLDPSLTGITTPLVSPATTQSTTAYTLTGVRVDNLEHAPAGIYILSNGRKVIKQ